MRRPLWILSASLFFSLPLLSACSQGGEPGVKGDPGLIGAMGNMGTMGTMGTPGPAGPSGTGGAVTEDIPSFAGYTTMSYSGKVAGGRVGMHGLCAANFAGSHFCHAAEYILSNSSAQPPTRGAWLDPSTLDGRSLSTIGSFKAGRFLGSYSCSSWNNDAPIGSGDSGFIVNPVGAIDMQGDCSSARQLACCNVATKARFAGFTASTTRGAAGGRWKMNALCAAAFAGGHICHGSEYVRANTSASVPGGGAWIDSSTINGTAISNSGVPDAARYVAANNCQSWSVTTDGEYGTLVTELGSVDPYGDCINAHPIACCL